MKKFARPTYSSTEEGIRQLASIVNSIITEGSDHNVATITEDYIADGTYRVILADCTSNAIAVTLKGFSDWEGAFSFMKVDGSANEVTISPTTGTINGTSAAVLSTQYANKKIVSDGTNGYIF